MIRIDNLSVSYETKKAVRGVSFDVPAGKISGLIGPNGAGKSSVLKACVGLINEFGGRITFEGHDRGHELFWVKQNCGFAPEDSELLPYLTGNEFLELIGTIRRVKETGKARTFLLDLFGMSDKADELIINYSHGMKQKLSIAAALTGEPPFIILDEALNGLDPMSLFRLKKYFRELAARNHTILISSHILPLIRQWCDPVIIMNNGQIIRSFTLNEIEEMEQQQSLDFEAIFVELIESSQSDDRD